MQTAGIHHVTAVASDPQENRRFYTEVLGLRLVKRTVNFDDTSTYHLYYGDESGTPGTVLTFFPFEGAGRGRPGRGMVTETAFVVPDGAIEYWARRLADEGLRVEDPIERFGETVLRFRDHEGQPLALVTGDSDVVPWTGGPVPDAYALRGFDGVTLHSADPDGTARVLSTLGYDRAAESDARIRFRTAGERASTLDVLTTDGRGGRPGAGTVHHVAVRAPDDETQAAWRDRIAGDGQYVTPVKDRRYFRSIYFREPGGVLVEVATDGPGFTRDESVEELGSALKLPPWLDADRERIVSQLPDLGGLRAGTR